MLQDDDIESVWDDDEPEAEATDIGAALKEITRITVDKGQAATRIDKFLVNRIEGATRNKIQQALDEGFITLNGGLTKANYKIRQGDEIVVYDSRRTDSTEVIPEKLDLDIVYEDEALMIINKKAGMVVHPGCGNYTGTLVNGLAYYLQNKQVNTQNLYRVGLVHRIDKDTSGLVVIAKTDTSMTNLASLFKKHTVYRRYMALAWGNMPEDEGTIIAHIGRNLRYRKIMDAYPDGDYGKEAITHYKVLERFHYSTLMELRLETGRTHQIRVHMKYKGHPLFGDTTYGGDSIVKGTVYSKYKQFVENCFNILPRHALHAKELGFTHPVSGKWIQFNSDLPADMLEVIDKWRNYSLQNVKKLRE